MDSTEPTETITGSHRRAHDRVTGPFEGRRVAALDTPVRIYDLCEGGCFVTSIFEQQRGIEVLLEIDLPYEGWITVHAKTLYHRPDYGFGVRFTQMTDQTRVRLDRALKKLREQSF